MPTKPPSELEKLLTFAMGASDEALENAVDVFKTVQRARRAGNRPAKQQTGSKKPAGRGPNKKPAGAPPKVAEGGSSNGADASADTANN